MVVKLLSYSLILFSLIITLSCNDNSKQNKVKVFKYNQINNITSLDPAFAKSQNNIWAINHLFNGLVQLDDSLNIKPCIAKSWEIINHTDYIFTLRDDIYFHDNECFVNNIGRRVVASDVVFSFSRILDKKVNSPGSWIFQDKLLDQPFVALNDSTFVLKLKEAFIPMLSILTMQYCSIVAKEAIDYYGENVMSNPVGTGPFKFKRWENNEALYLLKNENYFEKTSTNLDGIKTSFIPDRKVSYLELQNGNLDFVSGLESNFVSEWLTIDGELKSEVAKEINFYKSPFLNTEYIGINFNSPNSPQILQNKEFRQALNFAIDKKQMMETLRNNVGKPANSGITPIGLPSFDDEKVVGYEFNIEKAKILLDSIGFDGNTDIPLVIRTNQDYLDICTFVAKQWEKINISTEIEVLESSVLRNKMRNAELPLFRASWIADYPDAESFFCMFYSKNPAPPNYTRYVNTKFDDLYEKAVAENDIETRFGLYRNMEKLLIEDAPVVFLFYDETALFTSKRVEGISKNGLNLLQVKSLTIK
jgi:peptide/nickel transport system substrate-binding protein